MYRSVSRLFFLLLLLFATHAHAERTFAVTPSVGIGSSNLEGARKGPFVRVDGSFYPTPQFGIGLFAAGYFGLNGYGAGLTGIWPAHPDVQPYVRVDYMLWNATGLNRNGSGGSAGLAVGAQFPINGIFGFKAEVSGYNHVSGEDIRQFSLGLMFQF